MFKQTYSSDRPLWVTHLSNHDLGQLCAIFSDAVVYSTEGYSLQPISLHEPFRNGAVSTLSCNLLKEAGPYRDSISTLKPAYFSALISISLKLGVNQLPLFASLTPITI
jgi:hypothetical protein